MTKIGDFFKKHWEFLIAIVYIVYDIIKDSTKPSFVPGGSMDVLTWLTIQQKSILGFIYALYPVAIWYAFTIIILILLIKIIFTNKI